MTKIQFEELLIRVTDLEIKQSQLVEILTNLTRTIKKLHSDTSSGFEERDKTLLSFIAEQKKFIKKVGPLMQDYNIYQNNLLERIFAHADRCQEHEI